MGLLPVSMKDRRYVITIGDFSEKAMNQIIAWFLSIFGGKQVRPSRWNALRMFSPKETTAMASAQWRNRRCRWKPELKMQFSGIAGRRSEKPR